MSDGNSVQIPLEVVQELLMEIRKANDNVSELASLGTNVENLRRSVTDLSDKIDELTKEQHRVSALETSVNQCTREISELRMELHEDIKKIDEIVRLGNGKPALVTRVTSLETINQEEDKNKTRQMTWWGLIVTGISTVLGGIAGAIVGK